MSKIEIRDFSQEYVTNDTVYRALDHVNLNIEEGEFVCLIGHSGCGKSTLLSAIEGLLTPPSSGGIYIDQEVVTGPSPSKALIFQDYGLFPWMTVAKNIIFANEQVNPKFRKQSKAKKYEYALHYLDIVGLTSAADKYPGELSGGMRQRIAIARSLSVQPEILLADEPFGALDPKNRTGLQQQLTEIWEQDEKKITIIFVTHDIDEAILLSDRIIFMEPGQIAEDIRNTLPRPRRREDLIQSEEYNKLRNHLEGLFYKSNATKPTEKVKKVTEITGSKSANLSSYHLQYGEYGLEQKRRA